ncbi:hypothetical protein DFJ73DRAFT_779138 [Zopfochytrium polystomum]|nr:hypothetical protein DFJ73DRAFT_779138 [Zopfochytrium polystomum]
MNAMKQISKRPLSGQGMDASTPITDHSTLSLGDFTATHSAKAFYAHGNAPADCLADGPFKRGDYNISLNPPTATSKIDGTYVTRVYNGDPTCLRRNSHVGSALKDLVSLLLWYATAGTYSDFRPPMRLANICTLHSAGWQEAALSGEARSAATEVMMTRRLRSGTAAVAAGITAGVAEEGTTAGATVAGILKD